MHPSVEKRAAVLRLGGGVSESLKILVTKKGKTSSILRYYRMTRTWASGFLTSSPGDSDTHRSLKTTDPVVFCFVLLHIGCV